MTIAYAAATRKHRIVETADGEWHVYPGDQCGGVLFSDLSKCVEYCDRLNLLAVLEAIREPSEGMTTAAVMDATEECIDDYWVDRIWGAMIAALTAEVRG